MTLIPIQILYAHRHLGITQYDNDTTFFNDLKNSHTEIALPVVLRAFKNRFWEKKQTGIK